MKRCGSDRARNAKMETFDYVIIGAGSARSVLTNRLSEDAATSICVLEAGPTDWHPYIHLPAGFIKTFHMKSVNWAYQQELGPWTGGRIYAPRGKTLGGSSSINGHIYNHGQRQDFDTPGRSSAIAAGATRTCCPISSGWSAGSARAMKPIAGATEVSPSPPWTGRIRSAGQPWKRAPSASVFPKTPTTMARSGGRVLLPADHPERPAHECGKAFHHPARKRPNVDVRTHAVSRILSLKASARSVSAI